MSTAYWAGDAIATNLQRQSDQARANATLKTQQAYYCGLFVSRAAVLTALREVCPDHPVLNQTVLEEIENRGETQFRIVGLQKACDLVVDPHEVHTELSKKFEQKRQTALLNALTEPVRFRRGGWWWARRNVWTWRKQKAHTQLEAQALQAREIERLQAASLGDDL